MSNVLSFIIEAKDKFSAAFSKAQGDIKKLGLTWSGAWDQAKTGNFSGLLAMAAKFAPVIGVATATLKGFGAAWDFVKAGLEENAAIEKLAVKMSTVTGSIKSAREEIERLTKGKYSVDDLFSEEDIVNAAIALKRLSSGILGSAGDIQKLAGTAYATGQSLTEISHSVGMLTSMILGGEEQWGRYAKQLMSSGAVSKDVVNEMERMQTAGKGAGDVVAYLWANLRGADPKTLEEARKTLDGLKSAANDAKEHAQKAWASNATEAAKTFQSIRSGWWNVVEWFGKNPARLALLTPMPGIGIPAIADDKSPEAADKKDQLEFERKQQARKDLAASLESEKAALMSDMKTKPHGPLYDKNDQAENAARLVKINKDLLAIKMKIAEEDARARIAFTKQAEDIAKEDPTHAADIIAKGNAKQAESDSVKAAAKKAADAHAELLKKKEEAQKKFEEAQRTREQNLAALTDESKGLASDIPFMAEGSDERIKTETRIYDIGVEIKKLKDDIAAEDKRNAAEALAAVTARANAEQTARRSRLVEESQQKYHARFDKMTPEQQLAQVNANIGRWQGIVNGADTEQKKLDATKSLNAQLAERERITKAIADRDAERAGKEQSLMMRDRDLRESRMTPEQQAAESRKRQAEIEKQLGKETDPEKRLELRSKLMDEAERQAGLASNKSDAPFARSIGVGDIFTKRFGQDRKHDPAEESSHTLKRIEATLKDIKQFGPGGFEK